MFVFMPLQFPSLFLSWLHYSFPCQRSLTSPFMLSSSRNSFAKKFNKQVFSFESFAQQESAYYSSTVIMMMMMMMMSTFVAHDFISFNVQCSEYH